MPVQSFHELSAEPRRLAETYLRDVAGRLDHVDATMRDDLVADLTSHLLESLEASATADDVSSLIANLGSSESFSAALGAAARANTTAGSGRVLGMPYDVRMPTAERVAERLWNPGDSRIWMPRLFGIGWSLNFGALAVRLHLIEPDSEDVPFTLVPHNTFLAALAVPVALTAAMLVSYVVLRDMLPARLPTHWDIRGVADGFSRQGAAFGFLLLMALVPTVWAAWSVLAARPPLLRGAAIGFAGLFAALGSLVWLLTLVTALTDVAVWWLPILLICLSLAVPFGILLWLARVGRRAEQRRDLAHPS